MASLAYYTRYLDFVLYNSICLDGVRGGLDENERKMFIQIQQIIIENLLCKLWVIKNEARLGSGF